MRKIKTEADAQAHIGRMIGAAWRVEHNVVVDNREVVHHLRLRETPAGWRLMDYDEEVPERLAQYLRLEGRIVAGTAQESREAIRGLKLNQEVMHFQVDAHDAQLCLRLVEPERGDQFMVVRDGKDMRVHVHKVRLPCDPGQIDEAMRLLDTGDDCPMCGEPSDGF